MMSEQGDDQGCAFQPGEGVKFWQPVPAGGFVELRVSRQQTQMDQSFESGVQVVAPGGYVREHQHNDQQELILVYQGSGMAIVDGEEHPMQPGSSFYLPPQKPHKFVNTGETDLAFFWVFMPGGLADFFTRIGRLAQSGESLPQPFPRPDDVGEIEKSTVFGPLGR